MEAAGLKMVMQCPTQEHCSVVCLSYPRALGCVLVAEAEGTRETMETMP